MAEPDNTTEATDQDTSTLGPRIDNLPAEERGFVERMQRSAQSRATPGVLNPFYTVDPDIAPFKQSTPFDKERSFYGEASDQTIGDFGPVRFYDPQQGAPAVFGDPDVTYQPFDMPFTPSLGIDVKTDVVFDRFSDIDYSKVTPIVSIGEVYDFSNPEQVAYINSKTGFMDREGRSFPFNVDDNAEKRIEKANKFGAVSFYTGIGDADPIVEKIPYEIALVRRMEVPEDAAKRQLRLGFQIPGTDLKIPATAADKVLGFNKFTVTVPNYAEADLRTAEAMKLMNLALLEQSENYPELKDARTRLGILDYTRSIDFYDFKKVVPEYGRSAARFGFEFGGWFIGEGMQLIGKLGEPFGSGYFYETPDAGIMNSVARQEFVTKILPRYSEQLQRRLLTNGVDISLGAAEYLARYSLSLPPRALGAAVEFAMPTGLAGRAKAALSTADYNAFKLYRENAAKAGRTDIDDFNFLNEFIEANKASRTSQALNTLMMGKVVNTILFNRPGKWARVGLVDRLNVGKNLDEIDNLPVEQREKYSNLLSIRNTATSQRDDITDRIAKENRSATPGEVARLESLQLKIDASNMDMMAEVAMRNVPEFMRTATRLNNHFIITSAVGGQFVQTIGGDPGLGEGFGMIAGLVTFGGANTNKALQWVKRVTRNPDVRAIDNAEEAAAGISSFDPEFSEAVLTRVGYVKELRDAMIAEEVDPTVVKMSVGQLTGLAILQSLDATTRQQVTARQLKKFGPEVQKLIDIHSTEQQLVGELRGVFSRMSAENYPEGSAAARMQDMVAKAIEFAEADIAQRRADFDVLMTNAGVKVHAMIGDSMGKSLSMTDANRQFVDNFEDAMTQLIELGVGFSDNTLSGVTKIANLRVGEAANVAEAVANQALAELGTFNAGRATVAAQLPEAGVKVAGRDVKVAADDMPRFNSGADLQSVAVELAHVRDKELASAGFRILDGESYLVRTADGNFMPVGSSPYVDGGRLLDSLIGAIEIESGVDLIDFATGRNVNPKAVNATTGTLNRAARDFFANVAEEGEDIDNTIKNAVELASQDAGFADQYRNMSRLKGNNDAIIAAMYQRHLAAEADSVIDTMKISMTQLRKFDGMFRELGYKAKNPAAQTRYAEISGDVKDMFGQFVVDTEEGAVDIGQLFVQLEDGADPVEVRTALSEFLTQWQDYKANWFDEPGVARWMGWAGRDAITPNSQHPLGIIPKAGSEPSTWIKFDSGDTIEQTFDTWQKAIGTPRELRNGARHIDPNSDVGRAAVAAMKLQVAEWVNKSVSSKDFDITAMDETLAKIQQTFVGVDVDGNDVQLLPEIGKIIEDTRGLDSGAVPAKILQETREAEDLLVQNQKNVWSKQKSAYEADMNNVISVLGNYVPGKLEPVELITTLTNGGPLLVTQFRDAMKRTKNAKGTFYTDEEIDVLLGDMAVQAIEDSVFTPTGRMDANPRNPNQLIPQFNFNVDMLADFIGYGNRDKEIAMKAAMGESRYNVAKKMVEFIRNKENSTLGGFNISGIPRSFSVESYISRFYAINRDVIGPQYVATESILQRMRLRNFNIIQAALTDPEVGELFLEMLESGQKLPPKKEKELFLALVPIFVKLSETLPKVQTFSSDDVIGLPGWKVREMTEEPYGGSIFPLHPEYDTNFIKRIPTGVPLPTR